MSKRRKNFRADDLEIWRRVQKTITPLDPSRPQNQIQAEPPTLPISPKLGTPMPQKPIQAPMEVQLKKELPTDRLDGLARSQRRALKKGHIEPEARLDLHGLRLETARSRLQNFLEAQARSGHKTVLIITGKGGHRRISDFGHEYTGVIRRAFPEWMQMRSIAPLVSHYSPAHAKHGGEGAWYVFISSQARRASK